MRFASCRAKRKSTVKFRIVRGYGVANPLPFFKPAGKTDLVHFFHVLCSFQLFNWNVEVRFCTYRAQPRCVCGEEIGFSSVAAQPFRLANSAPLIAIRSVAPCDELTSFFRVRPQFNYGNPGGRGLSTQQEFFY
jgi:hypothetical protein